MSDENDSNEKKPPGKSISPFNDLFPVNKRRKLATSTSSPLFSAETLKSSEDDIVVMQEQLDVSTKFAFADLLSTILRLDFWKNDDKEIITFCKAALDVILNWARLPDKTNDTLLHHMQDDACINEDVITLIDVIKRDKFLQERGLFPLLGSLLIIAIKEGTYDSRFRVLLRHTSALLGLSWQKFEKIEDMLANHLLHDFIESDSSRRTREHLAKSKRFKRYALIGVASSIGAVLIGLTGGLAAPLVASGIGTITATTTFAGLATTAGSAIFGSVFGVAGGGLAGYRMNKRVGAIEEFVVESLTNDKRTSLHCVLTVSGWIEENNERAFQQPWRHLCLSGEQYTLRYESKYLEDWSKAMEYFVSVVVGYAIQRSLMETILAGLFSAMAWPLVLISSSSIIDNPWSVCFSRSVDIGEQLAEVLLSRAHGKRPITLIGFSLGARVIFHCLLAMSKRPNAFGIIEDVVLLGAPVSASPSQWKQMCKVVGGRVVNGYCKTDWLLRFLYRTASAQFTIAGTGPVNNKHEKKIVNINLSHIIKGHTEYLKKLTEVLEAVGIRVTPLSCASCQDLQKFEEENVISLLPGETKNEIEKVMTELEEGIADIDLKKSETAKEMKDADRTKGNDAEAVTMQKTNKNNDSGLEKSKSFGAISLSNAIINLPSMSNTEEKAFRKTPEDHASTE